MALFYSIIKLLILMGLQPADSLPVIEISDNSASMDITDKVEYYEDKSGKLTINDIIDSIRILKFIQNSEGSLNFGYTQSAYWIRFKIKSRSRGYPPFMLLQEFANMQYRDFYQFGLHLI